MPSLLRKLASSVAVIGAAAALPLFSVVAAFDPGSDPFPHSVEGPLAQD